MINIYAYLAQRSEQAADRFLEESHAVFERIAWMPGIGRCWESELPALKELRYTAVSRRFHNYLVFYRTDSQTVRIVTVLHGMQDLMALLGGFEGEDVP